MNWELLLDRLAAILFIWGLIALLPFYERVRDALEERFEERA